ncbi:MAG: hypothetical protein ABR591_04465 [Candidatus Velthaea sp.]
MNGKCKVLMRVFFALWAAAAVTFAAARTAAAAPPTSLDVSADRVDFFSNRFVVTAEGNVRVRLSDGTMLTAQTFNMDLKLNRYLLAGDVHLDATDAHEVGAAFAGYPDLDRSYFLPASGAPDRWTYTGLAFSHAEKGRQQPGDAFFFPDLTGERAYIIARHATILPRTNAKFSGARIYTAGVYLPVESWVQNFSANPNFSQNGFAGATADVGVPFNGSRNAITAVHARYDTVNKLYFSYDQHFVWDRDYIVASVNPATTYQKQWNLIGYKHESPALESRLFVQLSTLGHALAKPDESAAFENLSVNARLAHSALGFNFDNYNTTLLSDRLFEQEKEHPSDASLAWTGFDHKIHGLPLTYHLRSGIAYAHDAYRCGFGADCVDPNAPPPPGALVPGLYLLNFAGTPVRTVWYNFVGATFATSSIKIAKDTFVAGSFDKQRVSFSLPHHVDTTSAVVSLSRTYGTKYAAFLAYSVNNVGDYYGARQLEFYPPAGPIVNQFGTFTGLAAFRGFTTTRALTASAVVTPNQYFNFNLTVQHFHNFPENIPLAFGAPPLQATGDVRIRIARQILLDVSRTYFFNYYGAKWTPQFGIQFGP